MRSFVRAYAPFIYAIAIIVMAAATTWFGLGVSPMIDLSGFIMNTAFVTVVYGIAAVGILVLPWEDKELDETVDAARAARSLAWKMGLMLIPARSRSGRGQH